MNQLSFQDANCAMGLPRQGHRCPAATAKDLLTVMDHAGVERALVWHFAQRDLDPLTGNQLLTEAIHVATARLIGCWTILPTQCGDFPCPEEFLAQMQERGARAIRIFPNDQHWVLRRVVISDWLNTLTVARVPVILSLRALSWTDIYGLLELAPELTCIIADVGSWGPDRWLRPLAEAYPNIYVEISQYILAGGIAAWVERYGHDRLLYGSDFPDHSHGGMMLALRHADISGAAKTAIAGGNLERILAWPA